MALPAETGRVMIELSCLQMYIMQTTKIQGATMSESKNIFHSGSAAGAFFTSICLWGIGVGCFAASMNNFLSEICQMDQLDRGWLEFFRELPGVAVVFVLALMHRISDWKIMRIGTAVSMVGAALLFVSRDKIFITAVIMLWSMGEHLVMPVRSTIAMQVAKSSRVGESLGYLTSAMNFGSVMGSLIVMGIFFAGSRFFCWEKTTLFNIVWAVIIVLLMISIISTFSPNAPNAPSKRPRIYFNRKFSKFYALELFYGARKQVFLTFAPYVMIREYGFSTASMALLFGVCAGVNIFGAPLIGRLTDRLGYRNIMIWDTVILFFVCLLYGFVGDIFPARIAIAVLCINFLLDAVISTTSMATNIYVKKLSDSQDELTSTLSTGLSINHVIAILSAPLGGWVWQRYGIGVLFSFAAIMAVANTLFAMTIPKTENRQHKL